MKICQAIFILLLAINLPSSGQSERWLPQHTPINSGLNELAFIGPDTGWVCGDSGVIIHTKDGGLNWDLQETNSDLALVDIFFLDTQNGWALAWDFFSTPAGTRIFSTSDGGDTWLNDFYPEEDIYLNTVLFNDSLHGWMAGASGNVRITTDGGDTWQASHIDTVAFAFFTMYDIDMFDNQYGFISGGLFDWAGVIWKTSDGGATWDPMGLGPEPLFEVQFLDSLTAIGVGGDPEFGTTAVRTTDGGETWEYNLLEIFGIGLAVSFRTPLEAWAPTGFGQSFLFSDDGGISWTELPTSEELFLNNVFFADSTVGYAVGEFGTVLKYEVDPVGIVDETDYATPSSFTLKQNYPNPFNPSTTISYTTTGINEVSLDIYDSGGQLVKQLVNGQTHGPNHYQVVWDGTNINGYEVSSGLYFYTLQVDNHVASRKMLLIR